MNLENEVGETGESRESEDDWQTSGSLESFIDAIAVRFSYTHSHVRLRRSWKLRQHIRPNFQSFRNVPTLIGHSHADVFSQGNPNPTATQPRSLLRLLELCCC